MGMSYRCCCAAGCVRACRTAAVGVPKGYDRVMRIPFPGTTCWPRIARPRLSPPCPSAIAAILTKGHSSVDFDHTRRGYQSHHDHDETPRRGCEGHYARAEMNLENPSTSSGEE